MRAKLPPRQKTTYGDLEIAKHLLNHIEFSQYLVDIFLCIFQGFDFAIYPRIMKNLGGPFIISVKIEVFAEGNLATFEGAYDVLP